MKTRIFMLNVVLLGIIGLLVGCVERPAKDKESKVDSSVYEEEELPLSKALPEYEIWYGFSSSELTKDTIPETLSYFDGKNVESYDIKHFTSEFVSVDDGLIEKLSISKLLDMDKEEQLKYARQFTNGTIKTATFTEWWIGSSIDKEQEVGIAEKAITPYKLNIITDGSGNNTSAEGFYKISNVLTEKNGDIQWQLSKQYEYSLVPASVKRIPIYDYVLSGYVHPNSNGDDNLFITEVGKDIVNFTLDTPKDKMKNITVDEK